MKFLKPTRKPKVIYTDNSLEFGRSCEKLSWNHCTSTPHRSETNGIAERAVRRVKEETSAVWLQSGLGNEWWADSMECYCYLRNIQDLLSDWKTPYERRFGMPFNGPVIAFGAMVEYHTISAEDQSRLHQFGSKVLPDFLLGYALYEGWIWKGDIMVADIEELEEKDASELHARRLNAKEVLINAAKKWKLHIFIADGTVKIFGWRRRLRTSTLNRDCPERGEEQEILQGNSDKWYTSILSWRWLNAGWWESEKWLLDDHRRIHFSSLRWIQSQTVRAERRNIFFSDEVHRRYQNNSYNLGCIDGEK